MNIFSPLDEKLPEFKVYLDYHLEEKEGSIMGESDGEDFMAPPIEARETGLSAANLNGLNIKQQQSTLNDNRATD